MAGSETTQAECGNPVRSANIPDLEVTDIPDYKTLPQVYHGYLDRVISWIYP